MYYRWIDIFSILYVPTIYVMNRSSDKQQLSHKHMISIYLYVYISMSRIDLYISICNFRQAATFAQDWFRRVRTLFGISVSTVIRSSGPNTYAGPISLSRKLFGFDRFDNIGFDPTPPPLAIESQPDSVGGT